MKQLIILLLLIIAFFVGYGKYNQYKRYHSPEVNYKSDKKIDLNYHNKGTVIQYHKAIESLNSYVMLQWSANTIDVRTPSEDDNETQIATEKYAEKLATVKYYEAILENSLALKNNGLSNNDIKYLEETGVSLNEYKNNMRINTIKDMYIPSKVSSKQNSALIYEVQKQLTKKGFDIIADGIFKIGTLKTLKNFEEKNHLFADGQLDVLTLDALFE